MMTEEELNAELAELSDVLTGVADAEPWSAAWATRQSLLMRQNELFDAAARLGDQYEVEVHVAGPVEVRNSVPAAFVSRFLSELQLTVTSAVQAIVSAATDRGPFGQDVIGASSMSVVGARPGSFVLGLAGPPNRSVQLEIVDIPTMRSAPIMSADHLIARASRYRRSARRADRITGISTRLWGRSVMTFGACRR